MDRPRRSSERECRSGKNRGLPESSLRSPARRLSNHGRQKRTANALCATRKRAYSNCVVRDLITDTHGDKSAKPRPPATPKVSFDVRSVFCGAGPRPAAASQAVDTLERCSLRHPDPAGRERRSTSSSKNRSDSRRSIPRWPPAFRSPRIPSAPSAIPDRRGNRPRISWRRRGWGIPECR